MDALISLAIMVIVTVAAIGVMMAVGTQTIESTKSYSQTREAEQFLAGLDNAIKEVVMEGEGATRVVKITTAGDFQVNERENSIQYKALGSGFFEYFSRKISGDLLHVAGNDVNCYEANGNIVAENSYVEMVFQKVNATASISTANNIISMTEKKSGTKITFSNSSIVVDDNSSTSYGTGYSEILRAGYGLPLCRVHFYVNSTALSYDIYYTIYTAADFVMADVRNVVDK
jgi:type II secretory pathway pseudopilin PulG